MQKRPLISLRRALASLFRWMTAAIWLLLRAILIGWAALAIYYSNLPWWELRLGLAVAFTAFAIWVFWVSRRPLMYAAFAAAVSRHARMVAFHFSVARPPLAAGGRRHAAGDRRGRPRAPDGRTQLRLPQPGRFYRALRRARGAARRT